MRAALFGGSFNPPHISHQMIIFYLLNYKQFDEVHLIPAFKHAFNKELVAFEHRFAMCELLCKPFNGNAVVNGIERHLVSAGITKGHTVDTIREYKTRRPNYDLTLVIGADITHELAKWKDFDEVKKLVNILVVARKDYMVSGCGYEFALFDKPEVSSTEIRELLAGERLPEGLLYPPVLDYINKNSLYI
jgi:nicotinate-nucleotide adenylyltransferase